MGRMMRDDREEKRQNDTCPNSSSLEVFLDAETFRESKSFHWDLWLPRITTKKKKTPKAQGFDNHSTWMSML